VPNDFADVLNQQEKVSLRQARVLVGERIPCDPSVEVVFATVKRIHVVVGSRFLYREAGRRFA